MESRRHTLLIVDDEPDVLDSLRHLFHRKYNVLTSTSGEEALEILKREPVQLILTDQRMPGMMGDEFLARARERVPDAIRMLFTGYADIQAVTNAINRGEIYRYILKPWEPSELEATIQQGAQQYELLTERRRLVAELQQANERLRRANRDLAEADQLKSAFLEVASHEFNTPITIIQGLSDLLLLTDPERDPQERAILDQISAGTKQLARLVHNTLKLLGTGEFRERLRGVPTDLGALIREAADQVRPFVDSRRLHLKLDIAENLGTFEIDADKMRDVLLNLLTNAIKFTDDKGQIELTARLVEPDWAEIRVKDRGIGLEERAVRRLFSPFFTEFNPERHQSGEYGFGQRGLGLGLYLVKTFVEAHGGEVAARSTLGEGTEVEVRLPRRPCAGEETGLECEAVGGDGPRTEPAESIET